MTILFGFSLSNAYGESHFDSLESIKEFADTPTLHVYGESANSIHRYPFVEFNKGQMDWLDRVVKEKVVLMSESDISQYFELVGHDEIQVKYIGDDRFIKYYALRLSDPGLDLQKHNVKAFYQYLPPKQFTSINLDEDEIPQYLRHILEENDWTELTEEQYQELKENMKHNSKNYKIIQKDHAPNYWQIAYIGPELDEVKQGLFKNRQTQLNVSKSTFEIVPSSTSCIPAKSNNHAFELVPYSERFSVTDSTGQEIRRINDGNSVIVRFNPYNDWEENNPYVFEFGINYFNGNQNLAIYSERNTISESLCDVTYGYQWEFVLEPGSYEVFIDRINSGNKQEFDRRINVDKYDVYNALSEESKFLDRMSTPSFAETVYKITSLGSGNIGVSIEEVEWSPDGTFILFKQHERCHYIDDPYCISKSLWKLELNDSTVKKIPLYIFEQYGNANELKVSPDGALLAMNGYYTEKGIEHAGLFVYDFASNKLEKIIDRTKTHVTSFDWMHDGTILYHESVTQNAGILWNIDKNGKILEKVYEGNPNFGYIDVSSDGTKVSYKALEKEPGRSPPPGPNDFESSGTITWFDIQTKEFFDETITYNRYATTRWSPDNDHLYYLGIRPSPPIIGKLDVNSGKDSIIVTSDKPLDISSTFSLNPEGNLLAFALHHDMTKEYESIVIMDVENPSQKMVGFSESPIRGITCGPDTILLNEQCVSETFGKQQGCTIINGKCMVLEEKEIFCDPGNQLIDGICHGIIQEKSIGDDAPFFGIFVYLDNLISWIFGK